jgi:hypothetical protein
MNQNEQPNVDREMIDEYYSPQKTAKYALQSIVEEQMRAFGYDPTKEEDVKKFWSTELSDKNA